MTTMTPIAELEQQLNQALNRAVTNREDVVVERQGQEAAVILTIERYTELIEAEKDRARHRLREALDVVYEATSDIPAEEMDQMIGIDPKASRQARTHRYAVILDTSVLSAVLSPHSPPANLALWQQIFQLLIP